MPGYVALLTYTRGRIDGKKVSLTNVAVYQTHGNVLSAVYTYGASSLTPTDHIRVGLHAAEGSAENHRRFRSR